MSGNILILGAIALIGLFVGFGFLLGLLRGFRKSMYFTIVFIIVVILSFVFATMLAKNVYSGSTLWKFSKRVIPSSAREGAEGVNSLKEFVRFYITKHYTEDLGNGMTAGQSIVANENAMGIIDGLLIMILKIVMLIGSYLVLTVAFYLVFGLIYLLFLRQKPYIEETTVTDEDGNESTEEREVKPKKRRLLGGLVGGVKGLVKAMIILIPMTFVIGLIAQIEVPTSSSVSVEDAKLASSNTKTKTLGDIVEACRAYDKSIGKMQFGLDEFVMDKIISYDVKGADGKTVTVVFGDEVEGFIKVYNTIEKEIGFDNIKKYDFKNNLSSAEMRAVVESFTTNLSKSKATTTLLTAIGSEATVILKDKAIKKDQNMKYLFDEVDLTNKNNEWWQTQISQLNDIYTAFADMELDLKAVDTKEYNLVFKETSSQEFDRFIDELFNNELFEMFVDGGLKYAATKFPEDLKEVEDTAFQLADDKKVNEELKAFTKLIDVFRDYIKFKDGSVDMDAMTVETLDRIVKTEILLNSKLVSKSVAVLLKNLVTKMEYNGTNLNIDTKIFEDGIFNCHQELSSLVGVLSDGVGEQYKIGDLKNFEQTTTTGNVANMLESESLPKSVIADAMFSSILPIVSSTLAPTETYDDITWKEEYKSYGALLDELFLPGTTLADLASIDFDNMTLRKLDNLSKDDTVWSGKAISRMFNGLVIPFMEGIQIDGKDVTMEYDKEKIIWRKELASIVEIGLWSNDVDNDPSNDYDNPVNSISNAFGDEMKVKVLEVLGVEVQEEKQTELLHAFANGSLAQLFNRSFDSRIEFPILANVSNTIAVDGKVVLSKLNELNTIKVSTLNALDDTYKSQVLMDNMANNLSEPMNTESMIEVVDEKSQSAWDAAKWQREMPRINNVLKTLADDPTNPESTIKLKDPENPDYQVLDENSSIKRITFESIEDNVAYSEALENMFKNAMTGIEDSTNPFTLPNPTSISGDETFSAWWDAEITGLLNVVYKDMDINEISSIKLSEFSDSDTTKAGVVRSLSAPAKYRNTGSAKVKDYTEEFSQNTNIGVSEYLQYIFKPNFKELSTKNGKSYTFTDTYNWDYELGKIMDVFLTTKSNYVGGVLVPLEDNDDVTFEEEVNFKLLSAEDCGGDGLLAALKNIAIIESIKDGIDNNTYLQYVLAPEMKKMMSQKKDIADNYIYIGKDPSVTTGNETGWSNDEWNTEIAALYSVAKGNGTAEGLITPENPKMDGINLSTLSDDQVDLIGDSVVSSYLLQSKMADSLEAAGMPESNIRDAVDADWVDGQNTAYASLWAAYKATRP